MNLLECTVVEVYGQPYKLYGKYFVNVKSECYGNLFDSKIMLDTLSEALIVKKGYKYMG